jgi:hypothetical protein
MSCDGESLTLLYRYEKDVELSRLQDTYLANPAERRLSAWVSDKRVSEPPQ